jgi:hypothetical protein
MEVGSEPRISTLLRLKIAFGRVMGRILRRMMKLDTAKLDRRVFPDEGPLGG